MNVSSKESPSRKWILPILAFVVTAFLVGIFFTPLTRFLRRQEGGKIAREYLVEDVRQLASVLEESHPDPFTRFGGKIEFHRAMQILIASIPAEGLSPIDFYWHIAPFIARLRDSHTFINSPLERYSISGGGLPFRFHVVGDELYIAAATDSALARYLGMRLLAVEGVNVEELIRRQEAVRGSENEYHTLRMLGYDGSLWNIASLEQLLPGWARNDSISMELQEVRGKILDVTVARNILEEPAEVTPQTAVPLPSTDKTNYVFVPIDESGRTMLLLIENMYTYRESFEMEMTLGGTTRTSLARDLYERYNGSKAPPSYSEMVAGIPSATELARDLVESMRRSKTETLIIDLRRNQGGNAFISTIFYYFLHGKEALIEFGTTRSILIKKYSPHFWDTYPNRNLDDINKHQPIELTETDYDFSGYPDPGHTFSREDVVRLIEEEAIRSPTFWKEYESGTYSGYYCPKRIFILCSPVTTSSGYAFMYDHYRGGAKVVGTPSSQAGNNYGAWLGFRLDNSGLRGGVSHLYITHFRDDPIMGRVFRPDHPMTYEKLRAFNFDPNAEVLLATELSRK